MARLPEKSQAKVVTPRLSILFFPSSSCALILFFSLLVSSRRFGRSRGTVFALFSIFFYPSSCVPFAEKRSLYKKTRKTYAPVIFDIDISLLRFVISIRSERVKESGYYDV